MQGDELGSPEYYSRGLFTCCQQPRDPRALSSRLRGLVETPAVLHTVPVGATVPASVGLNGSFHWRALRQHTPSRSPAQWLNSPALQLWGTPPTARFPCQTSCPERLRHAPGR